MDSVARTPARRGRPRTVPSREALAELLCGAARTLFYRRGIRAVSVDDIVVETGVTKPSLYRSFPPKTDLVIACLRAGIMESEARLDALAERFAGKPSTQLEAIIADMASQISDPDYRGCAVTDAATEFDECDHPIRAIALEAKTRLRYRLVGLATDISPVGAEDLADGLMLLVEGASGSRHTSGADGPARALVSSAAVLIVAHCRGSTAGA